MRPLHVPVGAHSCNPVVRASGAGYQRSITRARRMRCPRQPHHRRQPDGHEYELPIEHGAIRTADPRQIKVSDDDFGLMEYHPAFTNTASARAASPSSTATAASCSTAAIGSRTCRAQQLPRDRVSDRQGRVLVTVSRCGATTSSCTPSCTRTSRCSWTGSATTPTRWACCSAPSAPCRPSTSGRQGRRRDRVAPAADPPPDRQARPSPSPIGARAVCRTSIPTTSSATPATSCRCCSRSSGPPPRSAPNAPSTCFYPARRPREPLHQRRALGRQLAGLPGTPPWPLVLPPSTARC